jgi:cephalosporin hydroxylase
MNLDDLEYCARQVVYEPWGVGDKHLKNNSESWAPYLRFLHTVVRTYRPKLVVECGVYMATATEHMAVACKDTMVIGIDIDFHPHASKVLSRNSNMRFIHGTSYESVEHVMLLSGDNIGLLFLDSEHDGIIPRKEYEAYCDMFADECLVACDDILDPRMEEFWKWLPGDKRELHFLHPAQHSWMLIPGFGISIVRS